MGVAAPVAAGDARPVCVAQHVWRANNWLAPRRAAVLRWASSAAGGGRTTSAPAESAAIYVLGIQQALAEHGYGPGRVAGVMGDDTRRAIRAYQRDAGRKADGVATVQLLDHLTFAQPRAQAASAGADGALVRESQAELQERGYYRGAVDGIVGPMTLSAVRLFERDAGLPVDGRVRADLLEKLRARPAVQRSS